MVGLIPHTLHVVHSQPCAPPAASSSCLRHNKHRACCDAIMPGMTLDVAVCLSGAPRLANWQLPTNLNHWPDAVEYLVHVPTTTKLQFYELVKSGEVRRPIDTFNRFLYPALGRFDIFQWVVTSAQLPEDARREAERVCNAFAPVACNGSDCPTFRHFCSGEPARNIVPSDLGISDRENSRLKAYYLEAHGWQQVLRSQHGMSQCNRMIQTREAAFRDQYKWFMRLRADLIFFAMVPSVLTLPLSEDKVYIRGAPWPPCCGSADIFELGPSDLMHRLEDRLYHYRDLEPKVRFSEERYAALALRGHGGCFVPYRGVYLHVFRFKSLNHTCLPATTTRCLHNYTGDFTPPLDAPLPPLPDAPRRVVWMMPPAPATYNSSEVYALRSQSVRNSTECTIRGYPKSNSSEDHESQ